jgi:hypothetical protein
LQELIFLVAFITALVKVRSANLTEIATAFTGKAKTASKYKRIQRFFRSFEVDFTQISKLIVQFLPESENWILSMDRTNWKLGKLNINILVIGIVHKAIAFPIVWISLPKQGNSNTAERIDLMQRFIDIFGIAKIKCLTADREFIGQLWFSYLLENFIHFRIRIRDNFQVTNAKGQLVSVKTLFRDLKPGKYKILRGRRTVLGHKLFVVGSLAPDGEYLIVVTAEDPQHAIEDYLQRWGIETLFGCLKSRGFRFESTHMTKPDRVDKLVALLAITFCWCHLTGEWWHAQMPIRIKKHGRKEKSLFRYGLDCLREVLLNLPERSWEFRKIIRVLLRAFTIPYYTSTLEAK